jgi:hypothetical protein
MDSQKVMAVVDWPMPRIAHVVHGFLGLVGYYRKFIRDFGIIAAPLIAWSDEATQAFKKIKNCPNYSTSASASRL